MGEIYHFGHDHPLVLKEIEKRKRYYQCTACHLPISTSLAYICSKCDDFNIHISCYEFPREMSHPFHPQHTLTLFSKPPLGSFDCHVCGSPRWGFMFHCSVCKNFDIDVHCADLEPKKVSNNNNIFKTLLIITHPHPMIICDYKNSNFNTSVKCNCCQQPIVKGLKGKQKGSIFVCLECKVLLDESCAQLPLEIQHPFHQQHTLTLNSPIRGSGCECNACGNYVFGFYYHCSHCDFDLDVLCASLMPITNDNKSNQGDENFVITTTTTTTTHCHPLITCHKTNNSFPFRCSGCLRPLEEDFIYVCLDCGKILHESCACLPRRILEHPYHPKHPLSLVDFPTNESWQECAACSQKCDRYIPRGYVYKCGDCGVILHSKCALPVAPLVNSQLHLQHPLAFLDLGESTFQCNACRGFCHKPVFRCVECNFTIHDHCLSDLPQTFKSTSHLHPLTLTNQPIKDYEHEDDESEFYCDACEKERALRDPTYYCSECHYIAHVHCVIPEILPCLQRESSSLGNELGNMKLDFAVDVIEDSAAQKAHTELTELDSEIATLQTGLDQLNTELEAITRQIETQTMKLDQLMKTHA